MPRIPFRKSFQPDPTAGDARAARLRPAAEAGDVATLAEIIGAARDPQDREFLVDVLSAVPGRPAVFDAWVAERPGDADALLARGAHSVSWAWEARGAAYAKHVGEDAFETFFERLRGAERDLLAAAAARPDDGVPWANLLTAGRGLQIPKPELRDRLDEAQKRSPGLLQAHLQYLQGVCAKWSGSDEEMFAFARDTSAHAPDGSPLHAVLAQAYLEVWLDSSERITTPDARRDVRLAAERSVLHSAWQDTPSGVSALNIVAMALWQAGEQDDALKVVRMIGPRWDSFPWKYRLAGPPAKLLRAAARG